MEPVKFEKLFNDELTIYWRSHTNYKMLKSKFLLLIFVLYIACNQASDEKQKSNIISESSIAEDSLNLLIQNKINEISNFLSDGGNADLNNVLSASESINSFIEQYPNSRKILEIKTFKIRLDSVMYKAAISCIDEGLKALDVNDYSTALEKFKAVQSLDKYFPLNLSNNETPWSREFLKEKDIPSNFLTSFIDECNEHLNEELQKQVNKSIKEVDEKKKLVQRLKEKAARDWPDDYSTQEYWVNEQLEAYEYMKQIPNNSIKRKAEQDWPLDFSTQKYWYNEQIEAKQRLKDFK